MGATVILKYTMKRNSRLLMYENGNIPSVSYVYASIRKIWIRWILPPKAGHSLWSSSHLNTTVIKPAYLVGNTISIWVQ